MKRDWPGETNKSRSTAMKCLACNQHFVAFPTRVVCYACTEKRRVELKIPTFGSGKASDVAKY